VKKLLLTAVCGLLVACAGHVDVGPEAAPLKADLDRVVAEGVATPVDGMTASAQPDEAALRVFADSGYAAVIDLRTPGEDRGIDEKAVVEGLGMNYVSLPVGRDDITFEKAAELDELLAGASLADKPYCDLHWHREAAQFRAAAESCALAVPVELVLSDRQLWMTLGDAAANDYQLHRVRAFECYADIPGVGGGRDEPYDRYDGFRTHDMGGQIWFTSKEGRERGISLFLVDWPINNYHGSFTRDSFVIYVSENVDGERRELGYAFTVPDADRIGINLKWMLASCFMKSINGAYDCSGRMPSLISCMPKKIIPSPSTTLP